MEKRLRLIIIVPVLFSFFLSGCSDKLSCWPFCSAESSSGVVTDDAGSTTDSTASTEGTTTTDYIFITGPNGGEVYDKTGWDYIPIRWYQGGTGSVVVELYKSGTFYQTLTSSTVRDQSTNGVDWRPDSDIPISAEYKIKVYLSSNSNIYDFSDSYFTLTTRLAKQ